MENDLEIQLVKVVDLFLRIGKDRLIEVKGAMAGVPAGGTKAGSEVDERIAG
jgi:hypothetical protein